jgi:dethiobiotin synthetase
MGSLLAMLVVWTSASVSMRPACYSGPVPISWSSSAAWLTQALDARHRQRHSGSMQSPRRFIITGTDTGVGKTVFAAGLATQLRARYWKPVQAGLEQGTDSEEVARLAGGRVTILPEAYRLATPCSPHEAARLDGVTIDPARLALPAGHRPLVVEGAGGVLVPHADGLLAVDLFAHWGLPVILVARTALGTINHTLLSLEALRARQIDVLGVVFSGDAEPVAEEAIARIGAVRHLGRLPYLDPLKAETLSSAFAAHINIAAFA